MQYRVIIQALLPVSLQHLVAVVAHNNIDQLASIHVVSGIGYLSKLCTFSDEKRGGQRYCCSDG